MPPDATTWSCSLHLSFRLLPEDKRTGSLVTFLEADGQSDKQVLEALPYAATRAKDPGSGPDPRRYRDARQLYTMLALLYEQDKAICLTALGQTLREWLPFLSERNVHTLGLYVARSLAAYQLRNPTTWGKKYAPSVEVFPFQFIWRAMLKLDDKLSSDELNREIFRVTNAEGLEEAIDRIRFSRQEANVALMSDPVLTGTSVNDRIIPWMSMASFGYTLISEKDSEGFYSINPRARSTLERFAFTTQKHRAFSSVPEYVQHIASMGGVPVTHPLNRNLEEQVGAH